MTFAKGIAVACLLAGAHLAGAGPVNINTATAEMIAEELDGIGLSKAGAIVAYREKNGPFMSIADLANVKGIGVRTLEQNQRNIRLEDAE